MRKREEECEGERKKEKMRVEGGKERGKRVGREGKRKRGRKVVRKKEMRGE